MIRAARTTLRGLLSRDPIRRRYARWSLLNALVRRADMRMYVPDLDWWKSDDHIDAWSRFPATNHDVKDRRFVVYSMAKSVADLEGDTAECGVFAGATSHLICLTIDPAAGTLHHVFDSFEGLSDPDAVDRPDSVEAEPWAGGDLAVSQEIVEQNLGQFEFVRYHAGWIPDRFDDVAERRFRFVHVDVDLYQPTRDSLAFFYDRLVPGGILLCDDYASTRCPGARQAFDELADEWGLPGVIELPTGQGFIVRR